MIDSGFHDVLGQVKRLLADSPFDEVRRIEVKAHGECISLQGRVHSFYLKQVAQETVRSATRGIELVNQVRVD
ncbi:MAG: BON domain-containing protein [Pirellulales bacterium]